MSLAVKDLSKLVKWEIDLAKLELKADVKRLGLAGVLLAVGAFAGCLVLVLLCFALAYGLLTLGIWSWASFLIVAGAGGPGDRRRRGHRPAQDAQAQRPEADAQDGPGGPGPHAP